MIADPRHARTLQSCHPRAATMVWLILALSAATLQAQTCPDTTITGIEHPSATSKPIDYSTIPAQFSFDSGSSILDGESQLFGAKIVQGERFITADVLHYDFATKKIKADGNVAYEDTQLRVTGNDANMDTAAGVEFDRASFALKTRAGHGSAERIQLTPQGNLHLGEVRYTTCPANKPDWELKLSDLDINQATRTGTGRNVRLEFKSVPIFYTPWISFPVGNERKSGFLFPSIRSSSRGGYSLLVPWYWNIAPNYDATFTPVIDTARGAELDSKFRYLSELSNGSLAANYLPNDPALHDWRGWLQFKHLTDFNNHYRLQVDGSAVSDTQWFVDFGQTRDETSQVYLSRNLSFSTFSDNWFGTVAIQNLQILETLDDQLKIASSDFRPYTTAPQISVAGREHQLPYGFDFDFNGELSYFTRNQRFIQGSGDEPNVTGARLHAAPELSLPLRTSGMYVIPTVGWRYTAYQLAANDSYKANYIATHGGSNFDQSPSLSAPVSSLDMAMTFERLSSGDQRLYTLQPRVLYAHTPYRKQDDLPVFDTGLPDFNLVQLFRRDRFIGPDRLGDTNQISTGITARMLDAHSGRQFLSGTLGQAFYLQSPCITDMNVTATCNNNNTTHSSPLIGQVALSAYKYWTTSMGIQWDPRESRTERTEVNFQYLPAHDKVINLSYRFARAVNNLANSSLNNVTTNAANRVDQWESSFAWPVGINWSTYGRVVYSRLDDKLHDYLGGIEYRSCCWNLRLVFGRSITTREGSYDTRLNLQFEFKGLGSAGTADTFLQNAIPGYSTRRP